jgi:xanthine dehydrogenase accessory factor
MLLEPLAVRPVVALFGIGHVGYELARILSRLPVQLVLVDSRAEQLDRIRLADVIDGSADISIHHTLLGEQVLEQLPRGAHVVIMTHDHAEDFALCDAALRAGQPLGGIGLIGSAVKWTRFQAQLAEMGHSPAAIARITCPIGLPGITGKDPATIAVAIAAELLQDLPASQRGAGADWTSREPKGRDAAWTDERGTSEEGRQHLEVARRRAGQQSERGRQSERESRTSGKAERAK